MHLYVYVYLHIGICIGISGGGVVVLLVDRHPYFGLLPFHLELHLASEGAKVCIGETRGLGLVIDRGLVTAANEESTELLVRALLLLSSMQQQQQQ